MSVHGNKGQGPVSLAATADQARMGLVFTASPGARIGSAQATAGRHLADYFPAALRMACTLGLGFTVLLGAKLATSQPALAVDDIIHLATRDIQLPTQPPSFSSDCRTSKIAGDQFRRPLRGLRRAIRAGREPRVLAIGSSSTVGVGASMPRNAYIAKLEDNLEHTFRGLDFTVVGKGMSGEVAEGQSARMKETIEDVKPDLVLWQVGTNDALHNIDIETFKACLRRTLVWLKENNHDVVLVDPQYSEELTKDGFYAKVVAAVAEVAREQRVLLVDRFDAMRELSKSRGDRFYLASDNLHLNDNGHRCMAEQLARAIVAGVLQAESEAAAPASR